MENNEIMNEGIEMMEEVVIDEGTGMKTGTAVLIGAGLALAAYAGTKLVKKVYAAYKAKKELRKANEEIEVTPDDMA